MVCLPQLPKTAFEMGEEWVLGQGIERKGKMKMKNRKF